MLLRRVTQHVKDENWFAVFVDFLIVVFGIFIGIQVTNWNEQRIENSLEDEYLNRLKINIKESIDSTKRTNKGWEIRTGFLNIVIDSLKKCEVEEKDKDNFAEGIFHLGKFEMALFNNSTLEEMKSTGRLGIINNTAINNAITRIEERISYQERVEPQLIARMSPHIFYVDQRAYIAVTSKQEVSSMFVKTDGDFFDYANATTYDLAKLCNDPKFIASIASVRGSMYEILEWNDRVVVLMDQAYELINQELGE